MYSGEVMLAGDAMFGEYPEEFVSEIDHLVQAVLAEVYNREVAAPRDACGSAVPDILRQLRCDEHNARFRVVCAAYFHRDSGIIEHE